MGKLICKLFGHDFIKEEEGAWILRTLRGRRNEQFCSRCGHIERRESTESKLIAKLYANGYNDAATFLIDEQDPRSMTDIVTAQQGRKGDE